jgi:hypothetical protein
VKREILFDKKLGMKTKQEKINKINEIVNKGFEYEDIIIEEYQGSDS